MSDNDNPNGIPTKEMPDNPKIKELMEKYEAVSLDEDLDALDGTDAPENTLPMYAQEEPATDNDAACEPLPVDLLSTDPDILFDVNRLLRECGIILDESAENASPSAAPSPDPEEVKPVATAPKTPPTSTAYEQPPEGANRIAPPLGDGLFEDDQPELAAGMRVIYDADDRSSPASSGRYPPVERFIAPEKAVTETREPASEPDPALTGMRIVYKADASDESIPQKPVAPRHEDSSTAPEPSSGIADLFVESVQSQDSAESKKKSRGGFLPRKADPLSEKIRKTVLILSVITMIVSSGFLLETYVISPYLSKRQTQQTIQTKINSSTDTDWSQTQDKYADIDFPEGMQLKYAALYAQNQDFVGWLKIAGTGIDMPVVQGEDNAEYLKKNFLGEKSKYACVFADAANDIKDFDRNTILYGHNMRYDDLMFGMLIDFRTPEFYKTAPVIEFNTLYADRLWKIYAVFYSNSRNLQDNGYVFNYIFKNLSSDEVFSSYIRELDSRKLYTTGVDILPTDKILTLSTCAYTFENARFVVVARMVRPGESPDVDLDAVTVNPNPRYPQAWYDRKRTTNPYANADRWFPS